MIKKIFMLFVMALALPVMPVFYAKLSAEEFADKHAKRLKAAGPEMRMGIERVTESPTAKAAAKQDKMRTKLLASIDDGTWARRLKGVSLEDWKGKMLNVGVGRVSAGIDASRAKVVDFAGQLLPAVDAAKRKIETMPDLTLEDNISRMSEYVREMGKFKKK